ncbi:mannosyltransferase [Weissella oryzae SG25]|uniref:Mannosyltransferase n=1 Tax=Weissella oryzae (strain DSM 25784 / JCM 18191 / LMG 30913 / SG25) TaxID=1329250 RepID=A0A069CVM2_WEIOS|nr:hypothetical protein [Weissella oryzae]GAK31534.1 mannosyltransferase [Weissella oryzae SG25]
MIKDTIWQKITELSKLQRSSSELNLIDSKAQVQISDFILPTSVIKGLVVDYNEDTNVIKRLSYPTIEIMTDYTLLETFVIQINPHDETLIDLDRPLSELVGSTVEVESLLVGGQFSIEDEKAALIATKINIIEKYE